MVPACTNTNMPATQHTWLWCADPDECSQAVAAESAKSTAHVRSHNPILSFSPHVTHLVADYSHLQTASAQTGQHSLLGKTAGMSRQRSSSVPANLVHQAVRRAPQAVMPSPSASALASSLPAVQGHQQSSLGHGHARAQRQLFSSLSDTAAPPRLVNDAAQRPGTTHHLGQAGSDAHKANQAEPVETESRPPSLAEVYSRQRLFVCKMCRNPARGLLCEPSSVQRIDYYQGNDMPLASFLAATAPQKCPNVTCGDGVTAHLRTFLHNRGRVTLSVSQLPGGKELPGSDKGQVWFWARPLQVAWIPYLHNVWLHILTLHAAHKYAHKTCNACTIHTVLSCIAYVSIAWTSCFGADAGSVFLCSMISCPLQPAQSSLQHCGQNPAQRLPDNGNNIKDKYIKSVFCRTALLFRYVLCPRWMLHKCKQYGESCCRQMPCACLWVTS